MKQSNVMPVIRLCKLDVKYPCPFRNEETKVCSLRDTCSQQEETYRKGSVTE